MHSTNHYQVLQIQYHYHSANLNSPAVMRGVPVGQTFVFRVPFVDYYLSFGPRYCLSFDLLF